MDRSRSSSKEPITLEGLFASGSVRGVTLAAFQEFLTARHQDEELEFLLDLQQSWKPLYSKEAMEHSSAAGENKPKRSGSASSLILYANQAGSLGLERSPLHLEIAKDIIEDSKQNETQNHLEPSSPLNGSTSNSTGALPTTQDPNSTPAEGTVFRARQLTSPLRLEALSKPGVESKETPVVKKEKFPTEKRNSMDATSLLSIHRKSRMSNSNSALPKGMSPECLAGSSEGDLLNYGNLSVQNESLDAWRYRTARKLWLMYVAPRAPRELNLTNDVRKEVAAQVRAKRVTADLFNKVEEPISASIKITLRSYLQSLKLE
jgi:hypothetical protein